MSGTPSSHEVTSREPDNNDNEEQVSLLYDYYFVDFTFLLNSDQW